MAGPMGGAPEQGGVQELLGMLAPTPPEDTSLHFMGLPANFGAMGGGGQMMGPPGGMGVLSGGFDNLMGTAFSNPQAWGMTRQDLESPLAYSQADWQPRNTGGYFTTGQLYDFAKGGARAAPEMGTIQGPAGPGSRGGRLGAINSAPGENVPEMFQADKDLPSTNNWQLLPPPYNQPQYLMRAGRIIDTNSAGRRSHDWGWSAGAWLPAAFNNVGTTMGEYPISGRVTPEYGSPGSFRNTSFWPGQLEAARAHGWPVGTSV